ncbi:hypothetical protein [Streptomyces sp. NPDC005969]|uniref:hypothetical protein n=1 Tax=Streptomyces sp. NPDC005969 TaxID=3156722 RepID=UPI0033D6D827
MRVGGVGPAASPVVQPGKGKSPLPDSRYNRPDDTVDATETDPLDAVPLFGKFKEDTAEP